VDRRRNPRVQILGKLHGQLVTLQAPITVTEISLGGLGFESEIKFPHGVVHEFRLTLGDESSVFLRGRVVHCRRISRLDEPSRYVVGVQFIDDEGVQSPPVGDLIDRVS
jgi:hypothetical protein